MPVGDAWLNDNEHSLPVAMEMLRLFHTQVAAHEMITAEHIPGKLVKYLVRREMIRKRLNYVYVSTLLALKLDKESICEKNIFIRVQAPVNVT